MRVTAAHEAMTPLLPVYTLFLCPAEEKHRRAPPSLPLRLEPRWPPGGGDVVLGQEDLGRPP
jgi:hypothetical protein